MGILETQGFVPCASAILSVGRRRINISTWADRHISMIFAASADSQAESNVNLAIRQPNRVCSLSSKRNCMESNPVNLWEHLASNRTALRNIGQPKDHS
jgi:hypothetical protein